VWDKHSAVTHDVRSIAPWATTAASLLAPWATAAASLAENVIIIQKKKKERGRGQGSEEEVVNVRSSAGFRLVRGNTLILISLNCHICKYIVLV
jgi:hypothetical protein